MTERPYYPGMVFASKELLDKIHSGQVHVGLSAFDSATGQTETPSIVNLTEEQLQELIAKAKLEVKEDDSKKDGDKK